jgi:hypothetical protein
VVPIPGPEEHQAPSDPQLPGRAALHHLLLWCSGSRGTRNREMEEDLGTWDRYV